MDEYAIPGKNSLMIPNSLSGIADILYDVITHYDSYTDVRIQAKRDAR